MKTTSTCFLMTGLLLLSFSACTSDPDDATDARDATTPTVLSNTPVDGAAGAALNVMVSATFSEEMDSETLAASTFTLTDDVSGLPIEGTVIYADSTAVFWPATHLSIDGSFTATISTEASSAYGVALAELHAWSFTTGDTLTAGLPVNLGTAGDFVMLAKSGISTVPPAIVTGDLGVSPAAASYITGFSLMADATNVFSTSAQITGQVYAANYASPTPSKLTTAIGDMELAFTDAAGRAPDVTALGAGDLGGMNLAPGVYKWSTGLLIPTDLMLTGSATDVWIFQVAQDLTMASDTSIVLAGGALPENVFWQVSGELVLDTGAHFEGIVLSQTSATLRTGASINGRLLAQTAVVIARSTVVEPM
jgi:hypothetical protein